MTTFKIVSASATFGHYAPEPLEYLRNHGGEVELIPQDAKKSEQELIARLADSDGVIVSREKITEPIIQSAKKLRIITKHGAGVDNIDVKAATSKGIVVTYSPATNSDSVADLTFGLFLALARNIPLGDRCVKEGKWPRLVGTQLYGKVLGIIGLGQIGKRVAKRALGFDMKVITYDISHDEAFDRKWGITYLPLEEVLSKSDFASVHIPLSPSTRHIIGERELNLMKKEAFLVNVSRGDVVDEEALYRILSDKKIKGAALDVFSKEPPTSNPLLSLENVILTPHTGGYTFEAFRESGMRCAQDIVSFFQGKRPQFVINPEVLQQS